MKKFLVPGPVWAVLAAVYFLFPGLAAAEPGFTGLQIQGLPAGAAAAIGLKNENGVLVRDVAVGGPAALAGFRRGDLIVKFGGTRVKVFNDLIGAVGETKPGQNIVVEIIRGGKRLKLDIKTIKRPAAWNIVKTSFKNIAEAGFTVSAMTEQVRKRFGLRWGSTGVVVTFVDPNRGAARILKQGDVIAQVNLRDVWEPSQLTRQLQAAAKKKNGRVLLLVERRDGFSYRLFLFGGADK